MAEHPVRVEVRDDLQRSRLTVLLRLLLVIPHFVWLFLWSIGALVAAVINWFATLFTGRSPQGLYNFLSAYVRYYTHVNAYLLLAASPWPDFSGAPHSYPIDVEIDPPAPQRRWVTAFRIVLAVPALLLAATLLGSCGGGGGGGGRGGGEEPGGAEFASFFLSGGGVATMIAILAWFACLVTGRMPAGFRDFLAYALRYNAQALAYVLLVTDRYPNSDPAETRTPNPPPPHPIGLEVGDDGRRSRFTVFFRVLLAFPHFFWLLLWTVVAFLAAIVNWIATLVIGRSPSLFHRFLSAYVRYDVHVFAFLFLVANPFPGFTGRAGSYPIDVRIDPRARQNRWVTAFRLIVAIPAFIVVGALEVALFVASILGWFASLATGRMPRGLRNLGAFVLRYSAQTNAYFYLLTDRYPFSGPLPPAEEEPEEEAPPGFAVAENA